MYTQAINKKVLLARYLLEVTGKPIIVGKRNLSLEEIEGIIDAICQAAEAVEGLTVKCTKLRR